MFYITFGQRYRYEEHPAGNWITPDGVVLIKEKSYEDARKLAFKHLGFRWAFMYPCDSADLSLYPKSVIGILSEEHGLVESQ